MKSFIVVFLFVAFSATFVAGQQTRIGRALMLGRHPNSTVQIVTTKDERLGVFQSNYCVDEHNQARADNGRGPLVADSRLEAAAERHNAVMSDQDCFSHQCNGEPGLGDRVSEQGYEWSAVGENIAQGYGDCRAAVEGWMNSQGHRENILGNYRHIGCHKNDDDGGLYTCVFGNPS